ncbi:MAG: hypothetical protein IJU39_06095 [Clostridia bacterium]|nr:hypothetical protein [Clostridia bacterium]
MTDFEDRDIKIFSKKVEQDDPESLIRLAEETARHRNNGNIAKAVSLGEKIAKMISDVGSIEDTDLRELMDSFPIDEKILYQVRLLLTFAAESTLHRSLNIPLLSTTAVNSMYDCLMECDRSFYLDTTDAFTFYYVAFRKHDRIVERIGRRFAMLCGKEADEDFERFGSSLYMIFCKVIESEKTKSEFVSD